MTRGERVREIRKSLNMTLEKFGEKIGIKKSSLSQIENGINGLTDQMVKSICREFNVNEEWLREGAGEMFAEMPEDDFLSNAVVSILKEDDALTIEGLKLFFSLTPDEKKTAANYILRLADMIRSHAPELPTEDAPAPAAIGEEKTAAQLEEEYKKTILQNASGKAHTASSTTGEGRKEA